MQDQRARSWRGAPTAGPRARRGSGAEGKKGNEHSQPMQQGVRGRYCGRFSLSAPLADGTGWEGWKASVKGRARERGVHERGAGTREGRARGPWKSGPWKWALALGAAEAAVPEGAAVAAVDEGAACRAAGRAACRGIIRAWPHTGGSTILRPIGVQYVQYVQYVQLVCNMCNMCNMSNWCAICAICVQYI